MPRFVQFFRCQELGMEVSISDDSLAVWQGGKFREYELNKKQAIHYLLAMKDGTFEFKSIQIEKEKK